MNNPIFDIVTGLSGAGKTIASHYMEDFGYFCVDNLPPRLIPTLAELCAQSRSKIEKVALVIDTRGREFFDHLFDALEELKRRGFRHRILFLDADDETLVKRFKETRRKHPMSQDGPELLEAISRERERMAELKERADLVIDTSRISPWELRDELARMLEQPLEKGVLIKIVSFGFKYGVPTDSDLVFDVRFLPNPNYIQKLQSLDGTCEDVRSYVLENEVTQRYLSCLYELIDFTLPLYVREGKTYLSISVGCTGGRHRSVTIAEELAHFLKGKGYNCVTHHRELSRSASEVTK